ncbi:MAG: hypothetical protein U9Q66_00520 [Patescibacteria group bacterium]|nr:hypothetical protein [Patescibacteria group bacterium]
MQLYLLGKKGEFGVPDLDRLNEELWKNYPGSNNNVFFDGSFNHVATGHKDFANKLAKEKNIEIEEVTWKPNMKKRD